MMKRKFAEGEGPVRSPIPTRLVSNGEYFPPPPSPRQKHFAALLSEMSAARAKKVGLSRRAFLRTSAGMATALVALNYANGCYSQSDGGFMVPLEATYDEQCAREVFRADYFIVDVQTHHVDLDAPAAQDPALRYFFSCLRYDPPRVRCTEEGLQLLSQMNFLKEVLIDSETAVGVVSGLPARGRATEPLPVETMAATRDLANQLACSERLISQGMVMPNIPPEEQSGTSVQDMEYQVKELGARAFKCYTGAGYPPKIPAWWLDDEDVSYPMLAEARRLGVRNICVHKGLPLQGLITEYLSTRDIPKAATDWPDLNFMVYHSGYFPDRDDVDEFIRMKQQIPDATNVYAELGTTFASVMLRGVQYAGRVLGKLLRTFGPDHILWGTDSVWFGSPQWQISLLKTFRIPDRLVEEEGYPQITDEARAQIFGLNAAKLYGLDPEAVRYVLRLSRAHPITAEYRQAPLPSNRRYGPVTRRGVLQAAMESGYSAFGAMLKGKVSL